MTAAKDRWTAGDGDEGGLDYEGRLDDSWSALAGDWAALWGAFADPARLALLAATGVGPGTRVLDVGCGSGELLALLAGAGADVSGVDVAAGMVALARRAAPAADVRVASAESLPWPDGAFDVVTAVNVLHVADDPGAALAEAVRVAAPGGLVAVCGWADRALVELDVVEAALAEDDGEPPAEESPVRQEEPARRLLADAGLAVEHVALVEVAWSAPDDDALVRGVLLGEDAAGLADRGPVVLRAARPFRTPDGGYRFRNAFRLLVARTPVPASRG
jgi:SAM-dependent methyltransferase